MGLCLLEVHSSVCQPTRMPAHSELEGKTGAPGQLWSEVGLRLKRLFRSTAVVNKQAFKWKKDTGKGSEGPWKSQIVRAEQRLPHNWISVVQDINASLLI